MNDLSRLCVTVSCAGGGGAGATSKVLFGENPGKIPENPGKICENLCKIPDNLSKLPKNTCKMAPNCFDLKTWRPTCFG